jgi:thiamine biosynthesis lipoprotein
MACEFEIILEGEDRQSLIDIANLAFDEVERLDQTLSCFRPTSEVSYLNAEAARRPVIVGPDLFEILRIAKQVWSGTDGAFDVTSAPLVDLWREAEKTGALPSKQAIDQSLEKVGMAHVLLDEQTHAVSFDAGGVRINLGAIGKGYAVRKAASILMDYGVESALVSGGRSTIQAIGSWNVGIRHPSNPDERVAEIELKDQAMSTSGGPAQRDRDVEEHFEHIIDPVTGMPAQSEAASVTVIADDAMLSDALATAFYLRGRDLAQRYPDVRAVYVSPDGQTF